MTTRSFLPWLRPFALMILAVCPSCGVEPRSSATTPRDASAVASDPRPSSASPVRRAAAGRPDPRYRPPTGFRELRAVAGEVARASGRKIRWRLQAGTDPGPLVRIRGDVNDCTISVHPVAARKVPPNTWAFLFGHEFAHLTESLGTHSATTPENELKADIVGARYAMAAGYRIEAFLGWVLTEPNQRSSSHGTLHQRVSAIARHFGVPERVIRAEARRASRYRAAR